MGELNVCHFFRGHGRFQPRSHTGDRIRQAPSGNSVVVEPRRGSVLALRPRRPGPAPRLPLRPLIRMTCCRRIKEHSGTKKPRRENRKPPRLGTSALRGHAHAGVRRGPGFRWRERGPSGQGPPPLLDSREGPRGPRPCPRTPTKASRHMAVPASAGRQVPGWSAAVRELALGIRGRWPLGECPSPSPALPPC